MEKGIASCVKLTKELKSKFIVTYATYLLNYLSQFVAPKFFSNLTVYSVSKCFTLAFSNTPGAIKPLYFRNKNKEKVSLVWTYTSMMTSGYFGI